jgi:hypothetical protein
MTSSTANPGFAYWVATATPLIRQEDHTGSYLATESGGGPGPPPPPPDRVIVGQAETLQMLEGVIRSVTLPRLASWWIRWRRWHAPKLRIEIDETLLSDLDSRLAARIDQQVRNLRFHQQRLVPARRVSVSVEPLDPRSEVAS